MAVITRTDASGLLGAVVTPRVAAVGDTIVGGQCVMLWINNAAGSSMTVTLTTPETVEGALAVADRIVTVTNGTWMLIPVPSRYNDPVTGSCLLVYTPVTSVTVAAVMGTAQA